MSETIIRPVEHESVDVRHLPTTVFGPRDTAWWATAGFMAIEGTTLFVCAASYLYLRGNAVTWPPEHTPLPSLFWPTVHMAVMLLSILPLMVLKRAATRMDLEATRRWIIVACVLALLFLPLRYADFEALNVRWDTNAYGSAAWLTTGFHATLLFANAIETIVFAVLMFGDRRTERHFSDVADMANYWYFMVLLWLPLWVLVFVWPGLQL